MFKGKKLLILGANPETANIVKVAHSWSKSGNSEHR